MNMEVTFILRNCAFTEDVSFLLNNESESNVMSDLNSSHGYVSFKTVYPDCSCGNSVELGVLKSNKKEVNLPERKKKQILLDISMCNTSINKIILKKSQGMWRKLCLMAALEGKSLDVKAKNIMDSLQILYTCSLLCNILGKH